MITKNNITEFYEKYRKNLEMEDLLNESVLRAEDEESWIERLRAKSKGLRDMYIENEAMLNLYLRPFLEQESPSDGGAGGRIFPTDYDYE